MTKINKVEFSQDIEHEPNCLENFKALLIQRYGNNNLDIDIRLEKETGGSIKSIKNIAEIPPEKISHICSELQKEIKRNFATRLGLLAVGKNKTLDDASMTAYWNSLGHLPYINIVFQEAETKTWYRDFDKTVSRFPEVSELIQMHEVVANRIYCDEKIRNANIQVKQLEANEKKIDSAQTRNFYLNAVAFALDRQKLDRVSYLNTFDDVINESIIVPQDYHKVRRDKKAPEIKALVLKILTENEKRKKKKPGGK